MSVPTLLGRPGPDTVQPAMPGQERKPVLLAETSDVRAFARLLRGIGFNSRARFVLNQDGFTVQVDEGRTMSATSYIPAQIFDKFELNLAPVAVDPKKTVGGKGKGKGPERLLNFETDVASGSGRKGEKRNRRRSTDVTEASSDVENEGSDDSEPDEEDDPEPSLPPDAPSLDFELNLHNLLSCLNIYGNATSSTSKQSDGNGNGYAPFSGGGNHGGRGGGGGGGDIDGPGGGGGGRRFGRGRNWAGGGNADDRDEGEGDGVGGGGGGGDQGGIGRAGGNGMGAGGRSKGGKEAMMCTGCLISWKGRGWPLVLVIKDQDPESPTTVCKIDLLEPEEMLDDNFEEEDKNFHIIMKSTWLREALSDLDPSCAKLTIKGGPKHPEPGYEPEPEDGYQQPTTPIAGNANARANLVGGKRKRRAGADEMDDGGYADGNMPFGQNRQKEGTFKIEAVGNSGKTELDYPNEREIMDKFDCVDEFEQSYAFSTFMLCQKALQASWKVSLRIDDQGFCSLQMMMMPLTVGGKKLDFSGIVEFKFRPLEEEDA